MYYMPRFARTGPESTRSRSAGRRIDDRSSDRSPWESGGVGDVAFMLMKRDTLAEADRPLQFRRCSSAEVLRSQRRAVLAKRQFGLPQAHLTITRWKRLRVGTNPTWGGAGEQRG